MKVFRLEYRTVDGELLRQVYVKAEGLKQAREFGIKGTLKLAAHHTNIQPGKATDTRVEFTADDDERGESYICGVLFIERIYIHDITDGAW